MTPKYPKWCCVGCKWMWNMIDIMMTLHLLMLRGKHHCWDQKNRWFKSHWRLFASSSLTSLNRMQKAYRWMIILLLRHWLTVCKSGTKVVQDWVLWDAKWDCRQVWIIMHHQSPLFAVYLREMLTWIHSTRNQKCLCGPVSNSLWCNTESKAHQEDHVWYKLQLSASAYW